MDNHDQQPRDIGPGVGCAVFAVMILFYLTIFTIVRLIWGV